MRPDGGCVGYYTIVSVVNALLGHGALVAEPVDPLLSLSPTYANQ